MKDKANIKIGASLPVLGILGAVLVVLKALGMIALSWVWVLAPFWLPFVAFILVVAIILVALVAAKLL